MQTFWQEELTTEQEAKLIETIVAKIRTHRMETAAILFFEMHKPLAGLAGQMMVVASPLAMPFTGFDAMNDYSRLIGSRASIEKLVQRLEESRDEPQGGTEDTHAMA